MKPELLMIGPLLPHTMRQLEAAYTLHRYDLAEDKAALLASIAPRVRAIVTRGDYPLRRDVMQAMPNVELIASSGAGYDAIDVDTARELGIVVTHTPGAVNECVADTAWALILATVRLIGGRSHHEAAGWHHHHFGTIATLLKSLADLFGLCRLIRRCSQDQPRDHEKHPMPCHSFQCSMYMPNA